MAQMKIPVSSDDTLVSELLAGDPAVRADLDLPAGVAVIGRSVVIRGELSAAEHLVIEGRVDGQIMAPDHSVAICEHGELTSDVFARAITVRGTVKGNLTATECVKILADGHVDGRLVAPRLAVDDGAVFNGSVDPELTDTAIAVQRHRLKEHEEGAPS